jgi:RES domain-containing protein
VRGLAKVPRRRLAAGTFLYRIHQHRYGPWFFDGSDAGRFNPTGIPGRGTCYWAETPLGAWVESFRAIMTWSATDIALRALSVIALDRDLVVADLTVKKGLAAGITVAITGGADYAVPRALADKLQGTLGAVRYRARHDLSAKMISVGWFGDEGAATPDALAALPMATTAPIPDEVVRSARSFGYLVLPTPP